MRSRATGLLCVLALALAACAGSSEPLDSISVPEVDLSRTVLGFSDEGGGLYFIPLGGGQREAIVSEFPDAEAMVWSPDGTKVAFHSRAAGDTDIYIADIGDGDVLKLTGSPHREAWPSWSPDSSRLVFERIYGESRRDLFTIAADGSDEVRITDREGHDEAASFSADGQQIVFVSDRDSPAGSCDDTADSSECNLEVYVMGSDGSDPVRLTNNEAIEGYPKWSPDGTQIVFHTNLDQGDWEIYAMNPDGSAQTNLTNSPGSDGHACWSPDAKRIAFESMREGRVQLYYMNRDGSDVVAVTGTHDAHYVSWSPLDAVSS